MDDRVSDERLRELAQGGCNDETQRIVRELIERRGSVWVVTVANDTDFWVRVFSKESAALEYADECGENDGRVETDLSRQSVHDRAEDARRADQGEDS